MPYRLCKEPSRKIVPIKSVAFAVLYGSQSRNLISPTEALDASYTVLQRSVSSAAGEAVSKLAARFAAGTDELAQLVRKDQDLTAEADRLDKSIIAAVSKPPAERNASAEDQIRKRIDEIKSERDKLQDVFNQRFPDYVALSKPQPLSIEQTQALLADDEALVVFDFDAKSYAWVITRTDARLDRVESCLQGPRCPGQGAATMADIPRFQAVRCGAFLQTLSVNLRRHRRQNQVEKDVCRSSPMAL